MPATLPLPVECSLLPVGSIPKLPPAGLARLELARQNGSRVVFAEIGGGKDCPNCGDFGAVVMTVALSGPYHNAPVGRHTVGAWLGDGWYTVERQSYPCPVCSDRLALIEYYWSECGLTQAERGWRVDTYGAESGKTAAVQAAHAMLATAPDPKGWLVLHGTNGVGKSGVLRGMVAGMVRAGVRAEYVVAEDLLDALRATYGEGEGSSGAIRDAYGNLPFLALDEVDRVSTTPWARATIMALLDHRHRNRDVSATAFATNADPSNLPDGWQYLQSRFQDATRVLMSGRDLRGIGGPK
jgi:hypothetical protein